MKPRITLITLGVDDLQRAVRFYRDGLGLKTEGIVGTEFEYGAVAFFGLQAKQNIIYWVGGAVLFGLLWYVGARYIRQQEGVNIDRVYAEIPPE